MDSVLTDKMYQIYMWIKSISFCSNQLDKHENFATVNTKWIALTGKDRIAICLSVTAYNIHTVWVYVQYTDSDSILKN
jgi:hypothetical protein